MRNKDSHDISALYEQVNKGKSKLVSEQMPPYGMGSEPIGPDALSKVDTGAKSTASGASTFNPANFLRNPIYKQNFTPEQCVRIAQKIGEYAVDLIKQSPNQIYPGTAEDFAEDLKHDVIANFTRDKRPIFNGTNAKFVARDAILMLTAAKIITNLTLKGKAAVKGGAKIMDPGAAIDELFAGQ